MLFTPFTISHIQADNFAVMEITVGIRARDVLPPAYARWRYAQLDAARPQLCIEERAAALRVMWLLEQYMHRLGLSIDGPSDDSEYDCAPHDCDCTASSTEDQDDASSNASLIFLVREKDPAEREKGAQQDTDEFDLNIGDDWMSN